MGNFDTSSAGELAGDPSGAHGNDAAGELTGDPVSNSDFATTGQEIKLLLLMMLLWKNY